MSVKHVNLARMTVSAGGTGTLTLGVAISGFLTFNAAGANSGDLISYAVEDGLNREIGRGLYVVTGGVATLQRTQIINSTNGNAAITVSANAQVFCPVSAQDLMPTFPKNDPHKAWRVSVVSTTDNSNGFAMYNVEFRQAAGVTEIASGGRVVFSSQHNGDVSAAGNVFAGHTSNALQWAPDGSALPQWVGYVYPTAIAPNEVRVYCSSNVKEMTLDYSDDDGWSWTTFCTLDTTGGIDGGDNLYPISRGASPSDLVAEITGNPTALAALASALGLSTGGGGSGSSGSTTAVDFALTTASFTFNAKSSEGFLAGDINQGVTRGSLSPTTYGVVTIEGVFSSGYSVEVIVSASWSPAPQWFSSLNIPGIGTLHYADASIQSTGTWGATTYTWAISSGAVADGTLVLTPYVTPTTPPTGG